VQCHCRRDNHIQRPGVFVVKVGTMDGAAFFQPDMAIFTKDAMPFHHIPNDIPNYEELPPGF